MPSETICKTVHQYNKEPVDSETMQKLQEIARDYRTVKNYVYQRYGGIKSLPKIYPGYTVQNEMTESDLRARLGLPAVYFYLAVFDALSDIKKQWTQTRSRVSRCIRNNSCFTPEDRHYLYFVMKMSTCFESILLGKEFCLKGEWLEKYDDVSRNVDVKRLHHYLRRQVRRHLRKIHTDAADGFAIAERAYRYGDHGIYISTKESRKRVFILLTDNNRYKKQLYIILYPKEGNIEICVPIKMAAREHRDYGNKVGLAIGMRNMFVTDRGNIYGEAYGRHQSELTEYVRKGLQTYHRNKNSNPGRSKYYAGKKRLEARLHTYINTEINRLIEEERPEVIYIPKLPPNGVSGKVTLSTGLWQRGYIRERLVLKCREHSIILVEVFGKNISTECSNCGSHGEKKNGVFTCPVCGIQISDRQNTAKNALNRGRFQQTETSS